MRKSFLLVALILVFASSAVAQEKPASDCRVRVLVKKNNEAQGFKSRGTIVYLPVPKPGGDSIKFLSQNQADWWKDNANKFPGICLIDTEPADYLIEWAEYRGPAGELGGNGWIVKAILFKLDAGKIQPPELFKTEGLGSWGWSKSDQDRLEKAVTFLYKRIAKGK